MKERTQAKITTIHEAYSDMDNKFDSLVAKLKGFTEDERQWEFKKAMKDHDQEGAEGLENHYEQ